MVEKRRFITNETDMLERLTIMKRLDGRIEGGWKVLLSDKEKEKFAGVIAKVDQISVEEAIAYDQKLVEEFHKRHPIEIEQ